MSRVAISRRNTPDFVTGSRKVTVESFQMSAPSFDLAHCSASVLRRKLAAVELKFGKSDFEKRHYALFSLMCVYGIELLDDNIALCHENMLEVFADYLGLDEADDLYRAGDEEVSTSARRFKHARVHALRLIPDQIEHVLDHPGGREHFAVIRHTLLRPH